MLREIIVGDKLAPGLREQVRVKIWFRKDLAIAATDGLLVTFALDGDAYGRHRRTAILNRMLEMLALES